MTRLEPLPFDEWGDDARAALPRYIRRPELYQPGGRPMPQALGLLAHHLPLGDAWLAFNEVLAKQTSLDPRLVELIIVRVAWCTRSEYEWAQHTRMALAAGLSAEELYAVPDGAAAAVWSPLQRAVLTAVDQIVERHGLDDATWAQLADLLSSAEILEVLFVAGAYLCFAVVTNSTGLEPDATGERVDAPALPDPID